VSNDDLVPGRHFLASRASGLLSAFVRTIDRTEFPECPLSSTEDLARNALIDLASTGKFLMLPGMIDLYCESQAHTHLSIRP
jgi:hypothetical protein